MKVAVVVGEFPAISETFVLDHITSLIDRGLDVTILAHRRRAESKVQEAVEHYGLVDKTVYLGMPDALWERTISAPFRLLSPASLRRPLSTLRSLDVHSYGRLAASLDLF